MIQHGLQASRRYWSIRVLTCGLVLWMSAFMPRFLITVRSANALLLLGIWTVSPVAISVVPCCWLRWGSAVLVFGEQGLLPAMLVMVVMVTVAIPASLLSSGDCCIFLSLWMRLAAEADKLLLEGMADSLMDGCLSFYLNHPTFVMRLSCRGRAGTWGWLVSLGMSSVGRMFCRGSMTWSWTAHLIR